MILTPEQEANGWRTHDGAAVSPVPKRTGVEFMVAGGEQHTMPANAVPWEVVTAYREVEWQWCK